MALVTIAVPAIMAAVSHRRSARAEEGSRKQRLNAIARPIMKAFFFIFSPPRLFLGVRHPSASVPFHSKFLEQHLEILVTLKTQHLSHPQQNIESLYAKITTGRFQFLELCHNGRFI